MGRTDQRPVRPDPFADCAAKLGITPFRDPAGGCNVGRNGREHLVFFNQPTGQFTAFDETLRPQWRMTIARTLPAR